MANTFPNEGLQSILNFIPRNSGSTLPSTLYLAAITSAGVAVQGGAALTATTVPSVSTVWASDYSSTSTSGHGSGGEPAIGTGGYARISMANTAWGAPAVQGSAGQRSTAAQQSFAQSTASWSNPTVVGYACVTASGAGAGIAYYYANFDDGTSVAVNAANIVLQVTPYWEFDY